MRIHNVLAITGLSLLLLSPLYAAEAPKTLFTNRCQGCHGPDGKGNQTMAKALQTNIPDLASKEIGKKPDAELLEALAKGKGKMPATTGLSDKDLKGLVAFVKGLSKGK
ncbi:MAG: cytochrome c [Deltaproteobacteria bacterium]|nr:cytochrome c [Deltaproteobacteria bacterium]